MINKKLSSIMCAVLISSNILSLISPVTVYAGTRQTLVEGSGKSPDIEIVRVDEEGNEIREEDDKDKAKSDNPEDEESSNRGVSANGVTYEEDLSGIPYDPTLTEMTNVYISTAKDMEELARNCRLDTWSRDKNVILQNDIILDGSNFKYIPIFGGIFDGQGHTISGLSVSDPESYTGLFCITQESAVINNLHVEGSLVPTGKPLATGGIVGDNYGLISGCTFDGNIEGYDYTGGIAGYNEQTGRINTCKSSGYIMGMHFTGGITGYNLGIINGCINDAKINITSVDKTVSIKDVDISNYTNKLLNLFGDNNKQDSTSIINSPVDVGGICGYSQGTIVSCVNNTLVGYEHVGYNVGGIAGRQNGYVSLCVNNGEVYGRKDVGGIVGQAEPYVVIDITEDIIGQLTSNMNSLHDLVNITLNDAGSESNIVTARLNMVKGFTDKALNDTSYLSTETQNFINGVMDSGTEVLDRIDYTIDELAKDGGALDNARKAADNASIATSDFMRAVQDLDINRYMTEDESLNYNQAKQNITQATEDYDNIYKRIDSTRHKNYYMQYINKHKGDLPLSSNLVALKSDGSEYAWPAGDAPLSDYEPISKIVHSDGAVPPTYTEFPSSEGATAAADRALNTAAETDAVYQVDKDTEDEFKAKYGDTYASYLESQLKTVTDILLAHENELAETTRRDLRYAMDSTKQSIRSLSDSVKNTKELFSDVGSRSRISLPKLSPEYQARSSSLIANIQGMSDNLGMLNNEMNSSNQQLVDDMIKVNDQFNVIMLLIADAIDGVLDQDYTDVYEDNSAQVAEECTDATVSDSVNRGKVHGDINTAGIAGTMAIEYDFDLESDITGIKDAAAGTTYRTKCVMRQNRNDGFVEGVKNCVGGICGLQEMGTILRSQNYGKLMSKSGDYVGGISGESLSTIKACYTKGILDGRSYIGGIAGKGYDITTCYSLPEIYGNGSCLGAIAGDNDQKGRLKDNFFVSDDLAGIDRVSYSGKAEPIDYDELISVEGTPSEFSHIKVSFIVDDETISVKEYKYGDTITSLPQEISDGEYIKWNWENAKLSNMHSDSELTGSRARYITTLAGLQLRESGQSSVLVDGKFVEDDILKSELTAVSDKGDIIESWKLTIPVDNENEHLIRYCPPEKVDDIKIHLHEGNTTKEASLTKMGRYYTFSAPGYDVTFDVEDTSVGFFIKYLKYEIAGIIFIILILMFILSGKKDKNKKHNKKRQTSKTKKKKSAKRHSSENYNNIIDLDLDETDV